MPADLAWSYCVSNREFLMSGGSRRCNKGISGGSSQSDDEASSHGRDRVWDVALGSDRRRLCVGNHREWQIARAAQRKVVLRGKGAPFGDQRSVGGDAECGVMVGAAPPAPFIIA